MTTPSEALLEAQAESAALIAAGGWACLRDLRAIREDFRFKWGDDLAEELAEFQVNEIELRDKPRALAVGDLVSVRVRGRKQWAFQVTEVIGSSGRVVTARKIESSKRYTLSISWVADRAPTVCVMTLSGHVLASFRNDWRRLARRPVSA